MGPHPHSLRGRDDVENLHYFGSDLDYPDQLLKTRKWKDIMGSWLSGISIMTIPTKTVYRLNAVLTKAPTTFFRDRKKNSKVLMEAERVLYCQSNL